MNDDYTKHYLYVYVDEFVIEIHEKNCDHKLYIYVVSHQYEFLNVLLNYYFQQMHDHNNYI